MIQVRTRDNQSSPLFGLKKLMLNLAYMNKSLSKKATLLIFNALLLLLIVVSNIIFRSDESNITTVIVAGPLVLIAFILFVYTVFYLLNLRNK